MFAILLCSFIFPPFALLLPAVFFRSPLPTPCPQAHPAECTLAECIDILELSLAIDELVLLDRIPLCSTADSDIVNPCFPSNRNPCQLEEDSFFQMESSGNFCQTKRILALKKGGTEVCVGLIFLLVTREKIAQTSMWILCGRMLHRRLHNPA